MQESNLHQTSPSPISQLNTVKSASQISHIFSLNMVSMLSMCLINWEHYIYFYAIYAINTGGAICYILCNPPISQYSLETLSILLQVQVIKNMANGIQTFYLRE